MESSSQMWGSPDAAMERVNAQIVEAQERAARATQVRQEMDALRATAKSPKGEVEAEADTSGRLVGLNLSSDALELDERALARLIVITAQLAAARAGEQALEIAATAFGEESAITTRFRDEIAERNAASGSADSDLRYL